MAKFKYKYQMYKHLQANIPNIYADARKAAEDIGVPAEKKGAIGLTGAISGCPSPLRKDIMEASEKGAMKVMPLAGLVDELRELVKDVYGDQFDACPVSTCEAGIWLSIDSLCTPPALGRGDNYRTRYICPMEKHMHHQGGYGRPFPAKYKDYLADRGSTAGELGFYGKRQNNLDTVIVPLDGADYSVHGIKSHPVPLLTAVKTEGSVANMKKAAATHAQMLSGVVSLGYETPGYGYHDKDPDGVSKLQRAYGKLAAEYNVPYIVDNAWGQPFIGFNPAKTGADVVIYSMDKATGAATSGLIIGKEDVMVNIRRAMGMHGDRWGTTASYGKAAYVAFDPGKEALLTQVQALKVLRDKPTILTKPIDDLEAIIKEEFGKLPKSLQDGLLFSKSYNSTAIEVNYEGTWKDGKMGIPIFSIEDMYAGSHLFQAGMSQMGIIPTISYDGNFYISAGQGTADENGALLEKETRWCIRSLVKLIEIVCGYAGVI